MKPHEETWDAVGTSVHIEPNGPWAHFDTIPSAAGYQAALERARLAAQAPAMARILLAIHNQRLASWTQREKTGLESVLRDAGVIP